MALDKYKKFMKEKLASGSTETKTNGEKKKYLSYYNPNSQLTNVVKEVVVRVLPNRNGLFFQQFRKHSFKIGTRKNAVCMYSRDAHGETVGTECPFCDFLEENKKLLDKETAYTLSAKDNYMILVYNHVVDEIQKYEVNDYGITDVLSALQALEDLDPDEEGFNLHFRKDSKGYAKVFKASKPENSIEDLLSRSKNVKEIPDIFKETIPTPNKFIMDSIHSLFELAISAFAPTFSSDNSSNTESEKVEEDVTDYDPNADDFESDKSTSNKDVFVPQEDTPDDSGIDDIKDFLEKRKKK